MLGAGGRERERKEGQRERRKETKKTEMANK